MFHVLAADKSGLEIELALLLQDAEFDAIMLQSEIHDLKQEKIQLGESLLEQQRELLAWEKKLQIAQETKQNTERERGKEGDVGAMKAEIHRMQVLIHLLESLEKLCEENFSKKTSRKETTW
jgi:uncharacterized protein with von Willebrand factor type A (vWA) domain